MKHKYYIVLLLLLTIPLHVFGQYEKYLQKDPEPTEQAQTGAAFSVIENGTGVGGFYEMPVGWFTNLGAELNFFFLRDSKQVDYIDPYYGYHMTIGRENNVYLFELMLTLKKRLFAREIDDNFRPFIAVGAGPVYGMNFPEKKSFPKQYRWTFNGAASAGVDIAMRGDYLFGISLQYRYMKFNGTLGETSDHSTMDIRIELGKLL